MHGRAARRQALVMEQLARRQHSDAQRARDIFAAFRANLRDSLAALRSREAESEAMLWADDQQKQWRRDIDAMQRRLDALDDEEAREIAAITDRYADVKPHTTGAAVVFALTREDAERGLR
jgi:cytochrome c553